MANVGNRAGAAEPDDLLKELHDKLPLIVNESLQVPEINKEIRKAPKFGQLLRSEWPGHADHLLAQTNPEITRLRDAREKLSEFSAYGRKNNWRGYAGHIASVILIACYVAAAKTQWHRAVLALHTRSVVAIWIAGGLLAILGAFVLASRSQRYADDENSLVAALWVLASSLALPGYAFAVWHWAGTVWHSIPHFAAFTLWTVGFLASVSPAIALTAMLSGQRRRGRPVNWRPAALAASAALAILVIVAASLGTDPVSDLWLVTCAVSSVLVLPQALDFSPVSPIASSSLDPAFRSRRKFREHLRYEAAEAERDWRTAVAERAILPFLRTRLNELSKPAFSISLTVHDAPGLRQMRANQYVVSTRVSAQFKRRLDRVDGGAIGIAGPRGVGKTTLLEAERDGIFRPAGVKPLTVMESVPVEFEARDFALHLYARLCTEVINLLGGSREYGRSVLRSGAARWLVLTVLQFAIWFFLAYEISTYFTSDNSYSYSQDNSNIRTWLAGTWWLLVIPAAISFLLAAYGRHGPFINPRQMNAGSVLDQSQLHEFALRKLDNIQFQQRNTTGWSGKIGLPFSAAFTGSSSVELTRQAMTYPELVRDFIDFLRATIRVLRKNGNDDNLAVPVVIIIDELDKISSPEAAQVFVNEVKALFNVDIPGCLYLISVSEDALASFERRGLPIRDAFDSAFDEVFRIDYLSTGDSYALLRNRIMGLPEPFLCLCHCLAGGLPRELIRVAREVTDPAMGDTTIGAVCNGLVAADLRNKSAALRTIISRSTTLEPWTSELIRYLNENFDRQVNAELLRQAAGKPPIKSLSESLLEGRPAVELLSEVQFSAMTYLYYCATLLEVFTDDLTEEQVSQARDSDGDGSFNALASIRQLFAVNTRVAWLTISAFRKSWGLRVLSPPAAKPQARRRQNGHSESALDNAATSTAN